MIMLRFGETKVAKEKVDGAKRQQSFGKFYLKIS